MVMRGVVVLFLVFCLSSVVVVQHVQGAKYNTNTAAGFNNDDAALQRGNHHDEDKDATLFTKSLTERAMQVMDDASLHEDDDDVNFLSFNNNGILHENILNL